VADHPEAPARRGGSDPVVGGRSSDPAAVAAAARDAAAGGAVRVQGDGLLAAEVRARVDGGPGGDESGATAVVDVDPTSASLAAALAGLGPDGVVVVAGRVGRVDLDVQTLVHRSGATVAGVTAPVAGVVEDG
jgi:hypothetical protein